MPKVCDVDVGPDGDGICKSHVWIVCSVYEAVLYDERRNLCLTRSVNHNSRIRGAVERKYGEFYLPRRERSA
jgi:hypothetical protein